MDRQEAKEVVQKASESGRLIHLLASATEIRFENGVHVSRNEVGWKHHNELCTTRRRADETCEFLEAITRVAEELDGMAV